MPDKMAGYLAAGLGKYIDIMALHTYYTVVPEDIVPVIQCYQSTMATYNVSSLPIGRRKARGGQQRSSRNHPIKLAFVARLYLLLWSNGVVRHYWYAGTTTIPARCPTTAFPIPSPLPTSKSKAGWSAGR